MIYIIYLIPPKSRSSFVKDLTFSFPNLINVLLEHSNIPIIFKFLQIIALKMDQNQFSSLIRDFITSELTTSNWLFCNADSFSIKKGISLLNWGFSNDPEFSKIFFQQIAPEIVSNPPLLSLSFDHFTNIQHVTKFIKLITSIHHPLSVLIPVLQKLSLTSIPDIETSNLNMLLLRLHLQSVSSNSDNYLTSKFHLIFSVNAIFDPQTSFSLPNQSDILISIRQFIFDLLYQNVYAGNISFLNELFSFVSSTLSHLNLFIELFFHFQHLLIFCFKSNLNSKDIHPLISCGYSRLLTTNSIESGLIFSSVLIQVIQSPPQSSDYFEDILVIILNLFHQHFHQFDVYQLVQNLHKIVLNNHYLEHFKSLFQAIAITLKPSLSEESILVNLHLFDFLFQNIGHLSTLIDFETAFESLLKVISKSETITNSEIQLFVLLNSLDSYIFQQIDFNRLATNIILSKQNFLDVMKLISGNQNGFDGTLLPNMDPFLKLIFASECVTEFFSILLSFFPFSFCQAMSFFQSKLPSFLIAFLLTHNLNSEEYSRALQILFEISNHIFSSKLFFETLQVILFVFNSCNMLYLLVL